MLCMLLRKHVVGGRLAQIRQVEGDRIVEVVFEHVDELGERAQKTLICEFMGRHSNLIFVGADGRILDSARRVTEQMSSVREVLPGLDYRRPPAHGKIPFDAPPEQIAAALRPATGLLYKAVAGAVSGLSLPTARELVFRASGEEEARAEQVDMDAVALGVARALEDVRAQKEPMLLCAPDGEVVDVTAFAYQSRAALERRRFDTLSEALDAFYRARDRAERIRQKSAALNKVLKNNIERCERKLALQQEALQGSERMEEYRVKGELLTAALHLAQEGHQKRGGAQLLRPGHGSGEDRPGRKAQPRPERAAVLQALSKGALGAEPGRRADRKDARGAGLSGGAGAQSARVRGGKRAGGIAPGAGKVRLRAQKPQPPPDQKARAVAPPAL